MTAFNKDVLFIHIPKTGGHSVRDWMVRNLPDVETSLDDGTKLPPGHLRLNDIEKYIGRPPESFKRIIAVTRNPYDQQLSQWLYLVNRYSRGFAHVHDITGAKYARLEEYLEDPLCDYHVAMEQHTGYPGGTNDDPKETGKRYRDYGGFYRYWLAMDSDGEIPDNLWRIEMEDIEGPLRQICGFDFPEPIPYGDGIKNLNRTPLRGQPRDYYSQRAAKLVEEKFGWAFDSGLYERWVW